MGQEKACRLRRGGRTVEGKALLETDHLLFRGEERLKISFRDLTGVAAAGGVLRLDWDNGDAELELGLAAEKWAQKVLHPPSLFDKLGAKAGVSVRLEGKFDADFSRELEAAGTKAARKLADLIFLTADRAADLARIPGLTHKLQPAGGLWVIYPKGVETIREIDVIEAGRAAGLKDTKVVRFSSTHTGLRFTIPVAARRGAGQVG
ncbi:MAG: DUF3052 domain-containing protein [Bryobacteraceae bacterium]|jgi:hypothetical protein